MKGFKVERDGIKVSFHTNKGLCSSGANTPVPLFWGLFRGKELCSEKNWKRNWLEKGGT